jgi:hypothetical protein
MFHNFERFIICILSDDIKRTLISVCFAQVLHLAVDSVTVVVPICVYLCLKVHLHACVLIYRGYQMITPRAIQVSRLNV